MTNLRRNTADTLSLGCYYSYCVAAAAVRAAMQQSCKHSGHVTPRHTQLQLFLCAIGAAGASVCSDAPIMQSAFNSSTIIML
jgi:hypothetical protein